MGGIDRMEIKSKAFFFLLLVLALILTMLFSISVGPVRIPLKETAKILSASALSVLPSGILPPDNLQAVSPNEKTYSSIILKIRLPRILLAAITGAALSVAGVAFQALLRNPLADPYVLGVSSGAALGACTAIAMGILSLAPFAGFIGALAAICIVYALAKTGSRIPIGSLLLAGIIMSAFLSSIISLMVSLLGRDMHKLIFWLMGSLSQADSSLIGIVFVMALAGIIPIYLLSRELDIILLGEEPAHHLGIGVERIKKILFVLASLITGAVVSVTGLIGFVGLIIPHAVRLLIGQKHNLLIIGSALSGSIFLIIADTAARTIIAPAEIPIGIITAMVGAPFFLFLLVKKKKELVSRAIQ